jgi:fibrillarin-like rRNA methylase
MRTIHVEKDLKFRLPGQSDEYCAGVEIGVLAAALSSGRNHVTIRLGKDNVELGRALGRKMGYHLVSTVENEGESMTVEFRNKAARPSLRIVASV